MNLYQFDGIQPPTERKSIVFDSFEVGKQTKEIDGESVEVASFEGVANVMEHEDLGGDIIHKGAFEKTLKEKNGKVPFFRDHKYDIDNYLGIAYLSEQGKELKAKIKIRLTNQGNGQDFYDKAKFSYQEGMPLGLSIGYDIPKERSEVKDGIRHIYEVKLWEVSGTPFPMNELSLVEGFKDLFKYSRSDLRKTKELIDLLIEGKSPIDGTPEQSTSTEYADLLAEAKSILQSINKS